MSYTKYKTEGFVIGGSNFGEANRSLNLFTRDFGLIRIRAQGVRELKSKLRYNLQNLFLVEAHVVRGKNGWVVTESYKKKDFNQISDDEKKKLLARVLVFLKRMVPGEEKLQSIFDIMEKGFRFLERKNFGPDELKNLEALMVLRILRELGYIKSSPRIEIFLKDIELNKEVLTQVKKERAGVIREINSSLDASGL